MKYWVWLQCCLRFGNPRVTAVLDAFGDAVSVFNADREKLENSRLFTKSELERLFDKSLKEAENILAECKKNNIGILTFADKAYPDLLRNIPDFPIVLYYKGELPNFNAIPTVCIVGPRECSDFGIKAAYSLSARLSRGGITVISGGAKGVDAAAHNGALHENAKTVAFLPCGIGYDYLKANEALRQQIVKSGCLISEFPPNYPLKTGAFQIRNRLMSGVTLGTVVIEADERSGALITARCAAEQGRDVFVVPGNPTLPQYKGSNLLLRDGAKPLLSAMDVFEEYLCMFGDKLDIKKAFEPAYKSEQLNNDNNEDADSSATEIKQIKNVSAVAEAIYTSAPQSAFCIDELSVFNDYNASELMTALAELELFGYIKAVPGGRYERI